MRYSTGGEIKRKAIVFGTGESERTHTATLLAPNTSYSIHAGGSNYIITKAGITGPFSTSITSPPRSESVRYLWLRTCVHGMVQNVPNDVHEGVTKSLRDFVCCH